MAGKVLKFPRIPMPKPTKPHKVKSDEARVNKKVREKKEMEE